MAQDVLKIKINFGISIILKYYYIFEYMLINNMFKHIYVAIDYKLLKDFRGTNDDYYNNYVIFINYINNFDNLSVESDHNNNYENKCVVALSHEYNIPIKFKIYKTLTAGKIMLDADYITISTKILGIKRALYDSFKDNLINLLVSVSKKYTIVLLGERTINDCKEYKIHTTFSIYDDLISVLTNYKDLTIESDRNNNEINALLNTFNLFNNSKLNVFIGNGGVSELIPYSSNNILGFTYKDNVLCINNYLHEHTHNINIFDNYVDFLMKFNAFFLSSY